MKNIFLILFFLGVSLSFAVAQDNDPFKDSVNIQAMGRFTGSEVLLRFAPSSPLLWRTMHKNKIGYTIEKIYINSDDFKAEKITQSPILPYSLEEWKNKTNTENAYVTAAAEAMYGTVSVNTAAISSPFETAKKTENEIQMRYALAMLSADMEKEAAQGLGLSFKDNFQKTEGFAIYSIYPSQKIEGMEVDTAIVRIDFTEKYEPYPVIGVSTEEGEHAVTITWDKDGNDTFSAFKIEKSTDGKTFFTLNENPSITDQDIPYNFYIDSVSQNYQKATYRITGITPFGDMGLPSETVEGQGIDLSPAAGFGGIFTETLPDGSVKIMWETIGEQPDLEGYFVAKALDVGHEFIYINEKPIRSKGKNNEFIDKNPEEVFNSYYTVYAHDKNGNISKSMTAMHTLVDSIPPQTPKNLKGTIDSLGVVRLKWEEGTEADLRGYRVYYANAKEREFVQLTVSPIANDIFLDTISLNTLSNKIYYKIAAIDLRYNASDYSEILELSKPDTIPPTSPFVAFYEVNEKGIKLDFRRSSSLDIFSHSVLRREKESDEWQVLATFEDTTSQFLDKKTEKSKWYQYAIQAKDQSENLSAITTITPIQFYDNGKQNFIPTLKAEFSKKEKQLRLFWEGKEWKDKQEQGFQVMILRKEQEAEFVALTTIQENEYIDYSLYDNQKGFVYVIKLIYKDGSESELSNQVKIDLR
ncbi:hypothetical protein WAF17_06680 [Bernardetia sp. ABR2-2B]|uniref:fibronectin type III domain-containing protein n=1 Tax=Bernardetia sp. ABR2-2B TaxID=3127472 RepID=UPI0030D08418